MGVPAVTEPRPLAMSEPAGRRLLATTVLGSGMGFLDGTIANVALPHIGDDLGADLAGLQWVVNGYTLSLASLILLGGSLGDRLGRKRVYAWGVAGFAVASVLVAVSPTIGMLVLARILQGVAAAALTPGSLALIQSSFRQEDRMRAVGAWTGTLGIATAGGPVVGGWLVGIDWRLAFWINVPLAVIVLVLLRSAPESRDPHKMAEIDWRAVVLAPIALAGLTWGLTAWPDSGASATTVLSLVVGVVAGMAFVVAELRESHPMVPPALFASRDFSVINVVTLFVYAALSGSMLFLAIFLQVSAGWSPLEAGAATVPISVLMFFLASRFGALATKFGPRSLMVGGAAVLAAGFASLAFAPNDASYLTQILPGVVVIGLGLSILVAPLTGTVLAAVPDSQSGLASGINNAVSRTASLIAVAVLPLLTGLSGTAYQNPEAVGDAYRASMWWCVALVLVGGGLTLVGLRRRSGAPTGAT
ncbi:MFS transporter [Flexivirga oryzae]|uniref:EmrB/QacA subfamily drug resistance transporter n=2 Tax=Flexivirga oryzae TaxID=1794944 RepID=A0A839N8V4_9MICO|nr:MFS transporter [Flexivirga oryzae]MBB2894208.1 EmrB/QacA subfamily drug resistance transporter [Flexivirga oryzae]